MHDASELCYKLNVPNFQEIVRDDWKENLDWYKMQKIAKISVIRPASEVIKEEYLNFNNINWQNIVMFVLSPGSKPYIHSDNYSDTIDDNLENPKITLFAINFLIAGSGRMDYYLPSQLDKNFFIEPNSTSPQRNWTTSQKPYKSYEMEPGAYLFNITVPHKATAYTNRTLVSLRPSLVPDEYFTYWSSKSWGDIVKLFENYII